MATDFLTLQQEVKRRATRDQSGTTFDAGVKFAINSSLTRISRDAPWRRLRRKTTIQPITSYVKGSATGSGASVTSGSSTVSVAGATFITDGIQIGRKVKVSASGTYYFINTIPSETTFTVDQTIYAATSTGNTYEILPQDEYILPPNVGHRMFLWHEMFGYPFKLNYIPDMDFYTHGVYLITKYPPTHYRMWGEDMAITQVRQPSIMSVYSTSTADTSISITVFGNVGGYPDYEVITTNSSDGTTVTNGTKQFSYVERVVKNASSAGRIYATANSATDTVAVMPVGDTTSGILYRKVQLYPLPNMVTPIHVEYYKEPYKLVNDGDVHEMGEEFDEAIILLATAKVKAEANLAEADRFLIMWQDEMRSLKRTNVDKIDWFPRLQRPRQLSSDALVTSNLLYRQVGGTGTFGPASRL